MIRFNVLIVTLCLGVVMNFAGAAGEGVQKRAEYFPVSAVRLTSGPFKTAQQRGIEYLLALDPDRLLAPYLKEAGLEPKAENYTNWENTGLDGHIGGHYLSALSYMYAATGDEAIGKRLDYMLSELKRCQDASADGYLCGVPGGRAMWQEIAAGEIRPGGFDLNGKWVPLYNIHKIYAGLKDAWQQTGREDARDMLVGLTDWMAGIVSGLTDEQVQAMLISEHGGLNEIFADVAVITGKPEYLALARRFSDHRILDPLLEGDGKLTGRHANTQIPKVIGYKRIADIENNARWEQAVETFWNDVVDHRSVSMGGNSVREHFHSPDDFSSMLDSEQGPETCNTYNMLRLGKLLYESSLDGRYVDYIERAMLNHILSSQNPVHGGFVYFTPMRSGHYRVYSQPQTSFWCCVGSGMENQARYGEYIYARSSDDRNIYVNLPVPSTLEWNGNKIEQFTDFPESGTVAVEMLTVRDKKFALNFRVPSWAAADGITVTLNGKPCKYTVADGYLHIEHKWKAGDRVEVTYPMTLHLEQLPDGSPNYSIMYGPVVLAADLGSADQTGLFADDSRGGHIAQGPKYPLQDMPVFVGNPETIIDHITRVSDHPLAFRLTSVYPEQYDGMQLVPFASLNECRYMVYWPVIDSAELEQKRQALAAAQEAAARLDAMTCDKVICGEQQPESDHFIAMENSTTGSHNDRHWRRAGAGGYFTYTMKADAVKGADTLRVWYKPTRGHGGRILLDDIEIGTASISQGGDIVIEDFPVEVEPGATVRVKVMATDTATPAVYEVRLLTTH